MERAAAVLEDVAAAGGHTAARKTEKAAAKAVYASGALVPAFAEPAGSSASQWSLLRGPAALLDAAPSTGSGRASS